MLRVARFIVDDPLHAKPLEVLLTMLTTGSAFAVPPRALSGRRSPPVRHIEMTGSLQQPSKARKHRYPAVADIDSRPSRAPDFEGESRALLALVTAQSDSRDALLQRVADFAMRLCCGQSAGISLAEYEQNELYFSWCSVSGAFEHLRGFRTRADDCPCSFVFEAGEPMLFTSVIEDFPALAPGCVGVREALVVPIRSKGRLLGSIWVATLDDHCRFCREDVRVLEELASVAGATLDLVDARDNSRRETQHYSEVIAVLAHEFRNPLAPLENVLQALQRMNKGQAAMAEYFAVAQRQITHLKRLMDELQDASRLDHDKLAIDLADTSLNDVLSDAVTTVHERISTHGHTLTVRALADDMRLLADPVRLTQIIVNLLLNAVRYTPDGGTIDLSVEHTQVGGQPHVDVVIRDNGIGIDAATITRIFEPFAQFAQNAKRGPRLETGLGIGLPIARRLAQLHGGDVIVTSAGIGLGTEARLSIPVRPATGAAAKRAMTVVHHCESARVLIVDDNADARFALGALLELDGHEVRMAGDGASALELLDQWQTDLALIDVGMPGMNGFELAARILAMPNQASAMLVALTGHVSESDRLAALTAGFHAHVGKPADIERLRTLLSQCARHR